MRGRGPVSPIDVLHDDVLLVVFDFYVAGGEYQRSKLDRTTEAWQPLVHVCRRWRFLIFASPRRLNLRLVCTQSTPTRKSLDVWPVLPLVVDCLISGRRMDDVIYALGHNDRVCQIDLRLSRGSQSNKVLATMQVPFPALTHLNLRCDGAPKPVIPDTFLGGSAPRLRHLYLDCTPFPGMPKLLLSATHLAHLCLFGIPHSGYISPEAMATCLSGLTSLDTLTLDFLFSRPRPDNERRRPPPMTRHILRNLTTLWFQGASEYLDDLVARIDAPQLDDLSISFLDETNINAPQLVRFISGIPRFEEPDGADVIFHLRAEATQVRLLWVSDYDRKRCVDISFEEPDSQVSSIAQVCTTCLPPLPTVEILRLGVSAEDRYSTSDSNVCMEDDEWLDLLSPFTAVKSLYLSEELQSDFASALQELVEDRTMEVLPSLQNIFLARLEQSGPFQETVGQFLAARQLSGYPIAVFEYFYDLPFSFCRTFSSIRSATSITRRFSAY